MLRMFTCCLSSPLQLRLLTALSNVNLVTCTQQALLRMVWLGAFSPHALACCAEMLTVSGPPVGPQDIEHTAETKTRKHMLCRLSAPLQLRLLTALCNDTLEGGNMRAELAGRVDQIAALHSERHQTLLEVLY